MSDETVQHDESQIDTEDSYADGDGLKWSIISVNVNERNVTVECYQTPLRTIPLSDLQKMKRCVLVDESNGVDPNVVAVGFGSHYTDQNKLSWSVQAVNLRERTVTVKLINPPRRTISVEALRKMRSMKRENEESLKKRSVARAAADDSRA